ncbi:galactose-1-phosphate uridylyltransferase [Anoxybacter fermentans]|uniref:Galactose-1-phosphate uridylyltransferase n=1 Tax=Anoxybacter fermentans TaxID=1323375 RepID=A0A3S9SWY1_9FIRM|nr:galactose-1-phosphate uridylyltransferase [Anoxybacter fermentans]AZR72847.1 galactose-1-phosphate uridylyltransferase [Anoxybacter fermentans]
MTQMRFDPITNESVIIAAGRSRRPTDLCEKETETDSITNCPFCPGNEDKTPPQIDALYREGKWVTRTFANKFPILAPGKTKCVIENELFCGINQSGYHNVIVEHPDHNINFFKMNQSEMVDLLLTYKRCYKKLSKKQKIVYVLIFKNYQKKGGASLHHPHSQVIASPFIPPRIKRELVGFKTYKQDTGRCIFCDLIETEINGDRQIFLSSSYLVVAPYASRFPYETWILPRKHNAKFEEILDNDLEELAGVILQVFNKLYRVLGDFPFNLYIHNGPVNSTEYTDFHWHLEIAPRLNTMAGFEIGGGIIVNTVLPEMAAEILAKEEI